MTPPIIICKPNAAETVLMLILFLFTDNRNAIASNTTIPRILLITSIMIISISYFGMSDIDMGDSILPINTVQG